MLKQKEVLVITGAGVSTESGIPTYRGPNGIDSKKFVWKGKEYEPEEIITRTFFEKDPEFYWQRFDKMYEMAVSSEPNQLHFLIHDLAKELGKRGVRVTLATQNIDDLHIKPGPG